MSKQPPPAPTASATGPCPTIIQISRTPRHWKITQHLRTTPQVEHPCTESYPAPSSEPPISQKILEQFLEKILKLQRGCRVVRRYWVLFQCRIGLLIWTLVGQGHIALTLGAVWVVWTFFFYISFLSLILVDGPI